MTEYDVVVVGGGPAGMMASIQASLRGKKVLLVDQNSELGKKLKITGGGRCNIASSVPFPEVMDYYPHNSKFLYNALSKFNSEDLTTFLKNIGIQLKQEGNKMFPLNERSEDIISALLHELKRVGVNVVLHCKTMDFEPVICKEESMQYQLFTTRGAFLTRSIIFAAGGASFTSTGSDWSIHQLLIKKGIKISDPKASLVGIKTSDRWTKNVVGIAISGIKLSLYENNKCIKTLAGDLLFTHQGISGPSALNMSAYITSRDISRLELFVDFLPSLSEYELEALIKGGGNKGLINKLASYLPRNLLREIIQLGNYTDFHNMNKKEWKKLMDSIKHCKLLILGLCGLQSAIVTRGGVDVKEINPQNMELKSLKNIFVAGEMIDVDGLTGGFNLQVAFSTGYSAGQSC